MKKNKIKNPQKRAQVLQVFKEVRFLAQKILWNR